MKILRSLFASVALVALTLFAAPAANAQLNYNTTTYPTVSGQDYVYTYNGLVVQSFDNASVGQFIWATSGYVTASINVQTYNGSTGNSYNYVVYINAYVDTTQYIDLQSLTWDYGYSPDVYMWSGNFGFPVPDPSSLTLADTAMDNLEYQLNHYFGHI